MKKTTALALLGTSALVAAIVKSAAQRTKFSFRNRSVLITGGSRGLGLVLARLLAKEGARLMIVSRETKSLEAAQTELKAAGATVRIKACDIRDRDRAKEAVESTINQFGSIDVLINNAGVIQVGPIEHMRIEDFENAMATHAWAPLHMILAAIPHMRGQGGGRIVNISSIGGKLAVPHMAPYSMSKFALSGISDGMRSELSQHRIYVTSVYPGLMRTGSHVNANFKGRHSKEFTWFSLMAALPIFSIGARRAARQIIEACRGGRPELIITTQARMAVIGSAIFPGLAARAMRLMNALLPKATANASPRSQPGWESTSAWSPSPLTRLADQAISENNEDVAA